MSEIMIPAWVDGSLEPVEKLKVHQQGLRHKAVSVFVTRDGEILLQQRAMNKYHTPGLWTNTCCTHPRWHENADDCAQRRLQEELGISGLVLSARGQVEYHADVGGGLIENELVDVYVAEAPKNLAISPNNAEVMDTRWVSREFLKVDMAIHPDLYTPWIKIYLDQHSKQIFG